MWHKDGIGVLRRVGKITCALFLLNACSAMDIAFEAVVVDKQAFLLNNSHQLVAGECTEFVVGVSDESIFKELPRDPDHLNLTWSLSSSYVQAFDSLDCSGPLSQKINAVDMSTLDRVARFSVRAYKAGSIGLVFKTDVDGNIVESSFEVNVVAAEPHSLSKASLNPRIGVAGTVLEENFLIMVKDLYGNAVSGVRVDSEVNKGNVILEHAFRYSGSNGIASFGGTLGTLSGFDTQRVRFLNSNLAGTNSLEFNISVIPNVPAKLALKGNSTGSMGICSSSPYRVELQDAYNNLSPASTDLVVSLSDNANGLFYSDAFCSSVITQVLIEEGENVSAGFYYKNSEASFASLQSTASLLSPSSLALSLGILTPLSHEIVVTQGSIYTENIREPSSLSTTYDPLTTLDYTTLTSGAPSVTSAVTLSSAVVTPTAASSPDSSNVISSFSDVNFKNTTAFDDSLSVSVFANYPADVPVHRRSCEFLGAFSSVACWINGIASVPLSLFQTGTLQTRAWTDDGGPNAYLDSNSIDLKKFTVKNILGSGVNYAQWSSGMPATLGEDIYFWGHDATIGGGVKVFVYKMGVGVSQITNIQNEWSDDGYGDFIESNGRLYFRGYDPSWRTKLFSTNGVDVRQHTNIVPTNSDWMNYFTPVGSRLYFSASVNTSSHYKIFSTDGSDLRQHSNLVSTGTDDPQNLTALGNRLFFRARINTSGHYKLFSTDGTDLKQHTNLVSGNDDGLAHLTAVGDRLFFRGRLNTSNHFKLFSTDGTDLKQHTNLVNGNTDNIGGIYAFKGRALFIAQTASNQMKLFSTDGTDLKQETNYKPGATDNVSYVGMTDDYFFYRAFEPGTNYQRLFVFDGTTHRLLVRINPTASDSLVFRGVSDNNVYFGLGNEEYAYDGSAFARIDTGGGSPNGYRYSLGTRDIIPSSYNMGKILMYDKANTSLSQLSNTNPSGHDYTDYNCYCSCDSTPAILQTNAGLYAVLYSNLSSCQREFYRICLDDDASCSE
jgi:hypothetical protein